MKNKELIIVESLTVPVFLVNVLSLVWNKPVDVEREIYYIETTAWAERLAKFSSKLLNINISYLEFGFFDIKDENGFLIRLRIPFQDILILRDQIINDPVFQAMLHDPVVINSGIKYYFKKQFLTFNFVLDTNSLSRVMALTHIALWKNKQDENGAKKITLYVRPRMWMKYLSDYSKKHGVSIEETLPQMPSWKDIFIRVLGKYQLRYWWYFWQRLGKSNAPLPAEGVKIAVDYNGHLNLEDSRMHSDVFFWQKGTLEGKDILVNFKINRDPLDQKKWQELTKHGMKAIGLTPTSTQYDEAPFLNYWPSQRLPCLTESTFSKFSAVSEINWFKKESREYFEQFYYWQNYFLKTQTKVYTTWYKYDTQHMIMADAIRSTGGVLTIYQRAFEEISGPETCVWADVVFGFSKDGFAIEKESQSVIPYYVVTGYIGDYRFDAVKPTALEIRSKILGNGARRIIAYFDENSNDNSRWHTGHKPMRENYAFLLEKVLQDPQLGLVMKPKTPATLRRRLGAVNDLLVKAEATGRCFIFEAGRIQGSYPPAAAALAADFAIHGHLDSATAGLESALTGTPTLLLDKEGWPTSKLYNLGPYVAFTNWEDLWKICQEHWKRPEGLPGFGDWSSMINDMDPFRDGKAAYRMGCYFQWLLEGFKNNWPREKVLAQAAQKYRQQWGQDKVVSINC